MDVTRDTFLDHLPRLLQSISNARFIAFDLELSGIPPQRRGTYGTATVQSRYAEMKQAAEEYSILQVGMTVVREEKDEANSSKSRYTTQAYNFNLSPLMASNAIELDRKFTYSASAVEFLLQHNYDMSAPFATGVPYLRHDEVPQAHKLLEDKLQRKNTIPDISLAGDPIARKFYDGSRAKIEAWLSNPRAHKDYAVIDPPESSDRSELSAFERRLVYQLIRAHYPDLIAFKGQYGAMLVRRMDLERERRRETELRRHNDWAFTRQFGFGWVAAALKRGDLSSLHAELLPLHDEGRPPPTSDTVTRREFQETLKALTRGNTVLVGHNCLIDLVYLFRYFYGELPARVEDFAAAVHEIFPLVIDTKFMATEGAWTASATNSQLWEINQALAADPSISIDIRHAANWPGYDEEERYHEAGYDSYVTAVACLRLASKLSSLCRSTDHDDPPNHNKTAPPDRRARKRETRNQSKFSNTNVYEALEELSLEETPISSSQAQPVDSNVHGGVKIEAHRNKSHAGQLPPWDDEFWSRYGNRMRAFGTQEEMLQLTAKTKAVNTVEPVDNAGAAKSDRQTKPVEPEEAAQGWTLSKGIWRLIPF